MTYFLGVDLGTTFTAAAVARAGRAEAVTLGTKSVAVPSVVSLNGEDLLVGQPAARRAATEPTRVAREFKRRVGDPTPLVLGGTPVAAELLMARLLQWVVRQVSATEGEPPAGLAVTHPANWGEYKLDLFRQAIRHVGVEVDHLVPEPVAAANFYASQRDLPNGTVIAVYDLGGGTFDAALVRAEEDGFRIIGRPDGIERLGGIDFDHAVLRHVTHSVGLDLDSVDPTDPAMTVALGQLRNECVDAKEALSSETDVTIPVMLPSLHTEVRLTRTEFEAMIRPAIDETLVALDRAIASASLTPDRVAAVLLVGGSSRMPLVGQMVMTRFNRPIAVDARPKDAIPLGAALTASLAADRATAPAPAVTPPTAVPAPVAPPGAEPSGEPIAATSPASPARSGGRARWAVAAAILLVVGVASGILLTRNTGSGTDTAGGPTTSVPPTDTTDSNVGPDGNGTGTDIGDLVDILGGGDIGSGTDTGGTEPLPPLPGNTWSAEARAEFVDACTVTDIGSAAATTGQAADDLCGCIYDEIESQGTVTFDELNEAWTATELDPTHPGLQAMEAAVLPCVTA